MEPLKYCIYTSYLAAATAHAEVAAIVAAARVRNRQQQLTGLLIFDGLRLCQYLEGPAAALDQMLATISRDTRHVNVEVREHALLAALPRRLAQCSLAYCSLDSQSPLIDHFHAPGNRSASSVLDMLLPSLKLQTLEHRRVVVGDQAAAGQDAEPQQQ